MRAVALAPAVVLMAASCTEPNEGTVCAEATDVTVDALELGAPDDGAFVPWVDGALAPIVVGPQGLDMLPVRLRLRGRELPACLRPTTTVRDERGEMLGRELYPLELRAEADGWYSTATYYVILLATPAPGSGVTVSAEAGGAVAARDVLVASSSNGPVGVAPTLSVAPAP